MTIMIIIFHIYELDSVMSFMVCRLTLLSMSSHHYAITEWIELLTVWVEDFKKGSKTSLCLLRKSKRFHCQSLFACFSSTKMATCLLRRLRFQCRSRRFRVKTDALKRNLISFFAGEFYSINLNVIKASFPWIYDSNSRTVHHKVIT